MKSWIEPAEIAIPDGFQENLGVSSMIAQVLLRRGLRTVEQAQAFLDPLGYRPARPEDLPGMDFALGRLERAAQKGEKVLVWGDFDVDGQTSTTLLVSGLRSMGITANFHIPIRSRESHGISLPVLKELIERDKPDILLTCDTGISAHEAISFARMSRIDVLVTDHHEIPDELPAAQALINPHFLPAGHPMIHLPGVGVAYKLVEGLTSRILQEVSTDQYLDLVALGIVADLAVQVGDVRYILQRGLAELRNTRRVGLQLMMEQAGIEPAWLTEEHISYELGPRLNALGRLEDANLAVELLTTQDGDRAQVLALRLESLNNQRKYQTSQVLKGAISQLEGKPEYQEGTVLVLSNPAWPSGIIGIVASQLVERYQKPVLLISCPKGEVARGSARSVEGLNITEALMKHAGILQGYGGHAMAAGFSIDPERIPEFRNALSNTIANMGMTVESNLAIDGYLRLHEITLKLAEGLERLAPFGPGNPALALACRNLHLAAYAPVGREGEHLVMTVEDSEENSQKVIWWQGANQSLPENNFDLAFTLRAVNYRGQKQMQLEWMDFRQVTVELSLSEPINRINIEDDREESHPAGVLQKIIREWEGRGELQIWAEGEAKEKLEGQGVSVKDRHSLLPGQALVIWTAPASGEILIQAMEQVRPDWVYVFSIDSGTDDVEPFLKRLIGLVKFTLSTQEGRVSLTKLAAAMAQTPNTVSLGLQWLVSSGKYSLEEDDDLLILQDGGETNPEFKKKLGQKLVTALKEIAAYRQYFRRASLKSLFLE